MQPEQWRRVGEIFDAALDQPTSERDAFLDSTCSESPSLRQAVDRLLAHDLEAASFLEQPLLELGHPPALQATAGPGDRLGPYRLIRPLREGGMGTVYLAIRDDDQYQQEVAIKLVREGFGSAEILRRFRAERQILARLAHPNIARLYDGGTTENGQPFLVLEYIAGLPITDHCARGRLSIEERLTLFLDVCSAVQYAHQNLLVHRDIKPGNVLVTEDGTAKLLDFGIAKLLGPGVEGPSVEGPSVEGPSVEGPSVEGPSVEGPGVDGVGPKLVEAHHTVPGQRPMTLDSASPEQVRGEAITAASDVYSLGVLLYRLLADSSPYRLERGLPHELEQAICEQQPEMPSRRVLTQTSIGPPSEAETIRGPGRSRRSTLGKRLAGDLDAIVLKALRKEPGRRYATVAELVRDLERHQSLRPVEARPGTLAYRAGRFLRRHRVAVGLTIGFSTLIVLLVGAFISTLSAQTETVSRERDRAERVVEFLVEMFSVSNPDRGVASVLSARQLLERGSRRASLELRDQPLAQATLLDTMGQIFRLVGMSDESHALHQESLELWRQEQGEEHQDVATGLQHLGLAVADQGELEEAERLLRQALAMARRTLGSEDPMVAEVLFNLAVIRRGAYAFDQAQALLQEALAIRQHAFGADDHHVAATILALGRVALERGERAGAESRFRQALEIQHRAFGEEHPQVAGTLSELGNLVYTQGRLADAEGLYRRALAIQREVYGDNYPEIADSLNTLGGVLGERGAYEEAERLLEESLALRRSLGQGQSPFVVTVLGNLGLTQARSGDPERALETLGEARRLTLDIYGDDHPRLALNSLSLARVRHEMGEHDQALEHYRLAAEMSARHLPPGHRYTALPHVGWSRLLLDRGDAEEAEAKMRPALEILRRGFPPGHWRIASAESVLAACLAARGAYEEAERLLLRSLPILEAQLSPRSAPARRARDWQSALDRAHGR